MASYSQMDVQVWTSDKSRLEREIESYQTKDGI